MDVPTYAMCKKYTDEKIKESGGGGETSNLPEVTTTDNGKYLMVKNGLWATSDKTIEAIVSEINTYIEGLEQRIEDLENAQSALINSVEKGLTN